MESFAFFLAGYQNKRDGLARERYFRMLPEIDFIGSYLYGSGISAEPQLSANIPQTSCTTFHQQNRIDICFFIFFEIPFFENLPQIKSHHFFKN